MLKHTPRYTSQWNGDAPSLIRDNQCVSLIKSLPDVLRIVKEKKKPMSYSDTFT